MDDRVCRIQQYLRSNFAEPISVEDLARLVNLSSSRLTHLFKSEVGYTPASCLKFVRLEKARELLETTFLSVKQIISLVGMSDKDNFRRDFKRAYGLPPREYRSSSNLSRDIISVKQQTGKAQVAGFTYK